MTLYGLISSLAWTASAVLFIERGYAFASRWLAAQVVDATANERPEIPDDLMALALSEDAGSEEATKQAQQSVVDAIYDAYRRYRDWNKVRSAMGVGTV